MKPIRTVVVDDEALARQQLTELVSGHDRLALVGEASDGVQALSVIETEQPDLVFLDIRMPGKSGLEVVELMQHKPRIIFTTAFEEFAVTAFELQALDYLLKPFGRRRFEQAVQRLTGYDDDLADRIAAATEVGPLERLYVRDRGRVKLVPVSEIVRIEAADDYAQLHTQNGEYLVSCRMKMLEERLDSALFVRIHRSSIVNLNHIQDIASSGNGRYEVRLKDGEILNASRSGAARLRDLIDSNST